jgi:hypothetical protein
MPNNHKHGNIYIYIYIYPKCFKFTIILNDVRFFNMKIYSWICHLTNLLKTMFWNGKQSFHIIQQFWILSYSIRNVIKKVNGLKHLYITINALHVKIQGENINGFDEIHSNNVLLIDGNGRGFHLHDLIFI